MTEFLDALRKIQAAGSSVLLASFDDAAEQPAARLKVLYVHDCGTKFDAMTNWAAGNFEPEKYAALV